MQSTQMSTNVQTSDDGEIARALQAEYDRENREIQNRTTNSRFAEFLASVFLTI
jgi:hypothetical protein